MSDEKARKFEAVVRRDGAACAKCGTTADLTLDHIVPKSLGGSSAVSNLQLLCLDCNTIKGSELDAVDRRLARTLRSRQRQGQRQGQRQRRRRRNSLATR